MIKQRPMERLVVNYSIQHVSGIPAVKEACLERSRGLARKEALGAIVPTATVAVKSGRSSHRTINRSPHGNKKHRDQFAMGMHHVVLDVSGDAGMVRDCLSQLSCSPIKGQVRCRELTSEVVSEVNWGAFASKLLGTTSMRSKASEPSPSPSTTVTKKTKSTPKKSTSETTKTTDTTNTTNTANTANTTKTSKTTKTVDAVPSTEVVTKVAKVKKTKSSSKGDSSKDSKDQGGVS